MGKKLYCGNLSFNTSSNDLDTLFSEYGTVKSAEVINDRDTGRSKGFGFVEMQNDQEAQAAIAGVNGREHDGRTLTVNEARPREARSGGGGRGGLRRALPARAAPHGVPGPRAAHGPRHSRPEHHRARPGGPGASRHLSRARPNGRTFLTSTTLTRTP